MKKVTVGFNAVPGAARPSKVARRDRVLERRGRRAEGRSGPACKQFQVDDYGAPSYPELVLATSRETLETDAPVVRATIRALRRGYEGAINDPESAVSALTDAERALDRTLTAAELDAVSPVVHRAGAAFYGELNPSPRAVGDLGAAVRDRQGEARRGQDVRHVDLRTGLKDDPNA